MLGRVLKEIETVAPTDSTVLIHGETGTGKELVARAIHNLSLRRSNPFVKLNCAAIPTGLLESELFGHEKGAFTGAIAQRIGRFELRIAEQYSSTKSEIFRLSFSPSCCVCSRSENSSGWAASDSPHRCPLDRRDERESGERVNDKRFRSDLYYRLNVFPIMIPPLRERHEDIPLLVRHFVEKYERRMHKRIDRIPAEAMNALSEYPWPGNVRELENFIERAVILSSGSDLELPLAELAQRKALPAAVSTDYSTTLRQVEREHILRALKETRWVVGGPQGAAARLGMKRTTLGSLVKKLGITRPS